jgi:hypothetical protein
MKNKKNQNLIQICAKGKLTKHVNKIEGRGIIYFYTLININLRYGAIKSLKFEQN